MIIGFCGLAGSGKSTAAEHFSKNHGFVSIALADPMKRIAKEIFQFSDMQLWGPSEERNKPDTRYLRRSVMVNDPSKAAPPGGVGIHEFLTPRHFLQQLGTQVGRDCYENVWVDYAIRTAIALMTGRYGYTPQLGLGSFSIAPPKGVAISDVRFKNEIDAIHTAGGRVVRLLRGGMAGEAGNHISETEQQSLPDSLFDYVINNRDCTIEQLHNHLDLAHRLWIKK
jgi:hypothetical protein